MNVRTIIYVAAAVMAVSCGNNNSKTAEQPQAAEVRLPNVTIMAASYKDVPQSDVYTANVEAYAKNNIAPQSPSRIQKIYVEVGDFVRAGQIVAKMDEVSLNQSKLSMANDSLEYSRIKKLYEQGGVSKSDFDAMELKYNVTRSQYQNLLENTILRSPVSGVITARNYDQGDMYGGSPIYVVEQITPVKLYVGISEMDYTRVKKNDTVTLTADALPGKTFTGRIARIYPTIDAATHTFTAEVNVANSDRLLRPGMYARVTVNFGSNHSIVVPDDCVVKQQGSGVRSVFVLQADNTVKEIVVTLGRHFGTEYEILSGIAEGDNVVVKGQASLKNGSKVNVQK
ncbi:efflux transporter MFP component RND family [Bacteroides sp. CAG:709]|nr:efflux transporter MFP component RND family [Bacteroides sp. CAG:709]